jgi:hypothetical protein
MWLRQQAERGILESQHSQVILERYYQPVKMLISLTDNIKRLLLYGK